VSIEDYYESDCLPFYYRCCINKCFFEGVCTGGINFRGEVVFHDGQKKKVGKFRKKWMNGDLFFEPVK